MLLVHGILHLLGFDHEIGAEESIAMAEAERYILNSLQWKVQASKLPSPTLASAMLWTLWSGHLVQIPTDVREHQAAQRPVMSIADARLLMHTSLHQSYLCQRQRTVQGYVCLSKCQHRLESRLS